MLPLKYLSNFWIILEISFINYEINLDLNWSKNCIIVITRVADKRATFSITDTKPYVPLVNLPIQDNANKYQPRIYVNKLGNTFKTKTGYYLEHVTTEKKSTETPNQI